VVEPWIWILNRSSTGRGSKAGKGHSYFSLPWREGVYQKLFSPVVATGLQSLRNVVGQRMRDNLLFCLPYRGTVTGEPSTKLDENPSHIHVCTGLIIQVIIYKVHANISGKVS
jgi:hypothetical protein